MLMDVAASKADVLPAYNDEFSGSRMLAQCWADVQRVVRASSVLRSGGAGYSVLRDEHHSPREVTAEMTQPRAFPSALPPVVVVLWGATAAAVLTCAREALGRATPPQLLAQESVRRWQQAKPSNAKATFAAAVAAVDAAQLRRRLHALAAGRPCDGVVRPFAVERPPPQRRRPSQCSAPEDDDAFTSSAHSDAPPVLAAAPGGAPRVAFVFGGEASYLGMGRSLYDSSSTFRAAMEECDAMFRRHATGSSLPVCPNPSLVG